MASPAYEQILMVQSLDLNLRQLRHRHQHHPVRAEITAVEADIAQVEEQLAEVESRHHDIERQRKRLEDEAALMQAKRKDIDNKLYGGHVTASKELLALQDEAAMLLGKQTELEDQELELMETLESVGSERDTTTGKHDELTGRRTELEGSLAAALAEIDAEMAATESQRTDAVASADGTLLASYEALKDQFDGVAVARLVNGACDGCHIHLSAVAVDQMGKMADDAVVNCEECGRLLVR